MRGLPRGSGSKLDTMITEITLLALRSATQPLNISVSVLKRTANLTKLQRIVCIVPSGLKELAWYVSFKLITQMVNFFSIQIIIGLFGIIGNVTSIFILFKLSSFFDSLLLVLTAIDTIFIILSIVEYSLARGMSSSLLELSRNYNLIPGSWRITFQYWRLQTLVFCVVIRLACSLH